ncbi:RNA-binding (RRM/RBD/RNP motifs) family protein [Striga hermonthica]|uniref:RNA-binding (RRM/RBD/RNP motifs) family protein n=1 Tax=Striga hermonthica TaxID=68872 RepID=A0A9N7RJJ7_STRHE|nr:RNA-binding (RRM/RBD/RNP motifs) family protein [Striga hermonthica]
MTIDANTSVYVGNLPYDITEELIRREFYMYGAILAVKIINDRATGGRCYGFVTFANPRSAMQAMKEMDGKTIDGRVVKVNEVKTRGGKANFNHERSRHDTDRSTDGDRGRDPGRVGSRDRKRHLEEHWERSQEQDRNKERSRDRKRDLYIDEKRFRLSSRAMDDAEQEHGRKHDLHTEKDTDEKIEEQRNTNDHRSRDEFKHQQLPLRKRSRFDDHGIRELSLESFNDDEDQGKNNLAISIRKLEGLRQEISRMEELVADKQEVVSKLQEKCQKLEDSLLSARKLTSCRHLQLAKMHKIYQQIRDYDERFKRSEQELQWLINSTTAELGNDGGGNGD